MAFDIQRLGEVIRNTDESDSSYGYTALKDHTFEYVIWKGWQSFYPSWFTDYIPAAMSQEELDDGSPKLHRGDVFVQNADGTITHYTQDIFYRLYTKIYERGYINLAAMKRDTLRYRYASHDITQEDDSEGVEMFVEFLNDRNQTMVMSMYDFIELFATYGIY